MLPTKTIRIAISVVLQQIQQVSPYWGWQTQGKALVWDGTQWVAQAPAGDATKLPLAGGTMSGAIDMGNQAITNTSTLSVNGGIGVGTGINSGGTITLTTENILRFGDADDSNFVGLKAPAVVGADITWSLPAADGTAGQVLQTDGAGNLSF